MAFAKAKAKIKSIAKKVVTKAKAAVATVKKAVTPTKKPTGYAPKTGIPLAPKKAAAVQKAAAKQVVAKPISITKKAVPQAKTTGYTRVPYAPGKAPVPSKPTGVYAPKPKAKPKAKTKRLPSPLAPAPQIIQPQPQDIQPQIDTGFDTGDEGQNELLTQLQDYITNQIEQGNQINPALDIDQATIDRFLEQAKREVHPFYAQQIDAIKVDVLNEVGLLSRQYESEIAGQEAQFQQGLGGFREQQAGAGTAFSGGRAAQELGTQAAQNRMLAGLSDVYASKFRELGRGAEEKIGAGEVGYTIPSLQRRQASLAGGGLYGQAETITPYTKGAFQLGTLPMQEEKTARELQQQYLSEAYRRAAVGRGWADLFT